jgi:hypothetical protein
MKLPILDLRRRMRDVLRALEPNETVTILYRGQEKGVIQPVGRPKGRARSVAKHPAFGVWKDRKDAEPVDHFVRNLRVSRLRVD